MLCTYGKCSTSTYIRGKTFFFNKEDFIENQQETRLTKTIYEAIYKLYNPLTTSKSRHYT